MQKFYFLLAFLALWSFRLPAQYHPHRAPLDNCDRVQVLLSVLEEFKGPLINDNAYECKRDYLLQGFKEGRVVVPGKDAKYWTVNMNSEPMTELEAETQYVDMVKQLMRCTYLNSWKGSETMVEENLYHFNFRQSISSSGHYKSILVSYYKLANRPSFKLEITLVN